MKYSLISATPLDRDWLEHLRRGVYRGLFNKTWGCWDEERHQRHFDGCMKQGNISIIQIGMKRVGMIQIVEIEEIVEINEIQIQEDYQNQGIGTNVLRDVITSARNRQKTVRLHVGLKNDSAVRLYERMGFSIASTSETHFNMEFK